MLEPIRFVQGAIAKKDFVPSLTHFRIRDGRIMGFNGVISLSSPIDLDLAVNPKAVPFVRAIQTCKEEIQLHVTDKGRLSIRSGKFRALVECLEDIPNEVEPTGDYYPLAGDLLSYLHKLFPFIADDASRPWARSIRLGGQSAKVTNNVILIEQWLDDIFPVEINLPRFTIVELLRIKEEPIGMQVTDSNITFHYENGRWLYSQLISSDWPDITPIFEKPTGAFVVPPEGLWNAIDDLVPFADQYGRVYFENGGLAARDEGSEATEAAGAFIEIPGLPEGPCFYGKYLSLLREVIDRIDFSTYPAPCIFYGDKMRGAIIGMRR